MTMVMTMSDKPYIPLSRLRQLWRQAHISWVNNVGMSDDVFRFYVDSEVAEMTIAALRKRIAELEAVGEWQPVPKGTYKNHYHTSLIEIGPNRQISIWSIKQSEYICIFTPPKDMQLMRRVTAATNEQPRP